MTDSDVRARLESAVVAAMDDEQPMRWGTDDCGLWCANILQPVLGYDIGQRYRGRYRTQRGAARVLGPRGLIGGLRRVARLHGWVRIAPEMARPGDMGTVWTTTVDGKHTLATVICRGSGWFVGRNESGFTAFRSDTVAICWSVLGGRDNGVGASVSLPRAWQPKEIDGVMMTPSNAQLEADFMKLQIEFDDQAAVALIERQRSVAATLESDSRVPGPCAVGCFAQLTTVFRDRIETRILKRWPDVVGEKILKGIAA